MGVDTITSATFSWNAVKVAVKESFKQLPAKRAAIAKINAYVPSKNIDQDVIKTAKKKLHYGYQSREEYCKSGQDC